MILRRFVYATVLAALPGIAFAQVGPVPVVDIGNQIHFVTMVSQQAQQITHQVQQLEHLAAQVQAAKANLADYRGSGLWTKISSRLQNLAASVAAAKDAHTITPSVANAQIAQMNSEQTTLTALQALANGSQGALQAQSAQSRLLSEMITQLQEQRQLSLAQIKQDELGRQNSLRYLHGGNEQHPSQY